jgi:hypothetical protein
MNDLNEYMDNYSREWNDNSLIYDDSEQLDMTIEMCYAMTNETDEDQTDD